MVRVLGVADWDFACDLQLNAYDVGFLTLESWMFRVSLKISGLGCRIQRPRSTQYPGIYKGLYKGSIRDSKASFKRIGLSTPGLNMQRSSLPESCEVFRP